MQLTFPLPDQPYDLVEVNGQQVPVMAAVTGTIDCLIYNLKQGVEVVSIAVTVQWRTKGTSQPITTYSREIKTIPGTWVDTQQQGKLIGTLTEVLAQHGTPTTLEDGTPDYERNPDGTYKLPPHLMPAFAYYQYVAHNVPIKLHDLMTQVALRYTDELVTR